MEDSKIRNNEQFQEEIKMRQVVSFCVSEVERLYPDISPEEKDEIVEITAKNPKFIARKKEFWIF